MRHYNKKKDFSLSLFVVVEIINKLVVVVVEEVEENGKFFEEIFVMKWIYMEQERKEKKNWGVFLVGPMQECL